MRLACNISTLFTALPLEQRFAAAAEAGFDAVEMQFPYDAPAARLAAARAAAGVQIVLINMPAGGQPGDLGIAGVPGREAEFAASIDRAAAYFEALGCAQVNCLAGRSAAVDRAAVLPVLHKNLSLAATRFEHLGIRMRIEMLNRVDRPGFLIGSLTEAESVLRAVAHRNLALQYDVYHLAMNGEDYIGELARWIGRIGHLQISDVPGRGVPGSGRLDFAALFAELRRLTYAGWIGCEYLAAAPVRQDFEWRARFC